MTTTQAFHRATEPLFTLLTREQTLRLADWPGDPKIGERVEQLAAKANEGALTETERDEYEAYIDANNLLAILQSEARYFVAQAER